MDSSTQQNIDASPKSAASTMNSPSSPLSDEELESPISSRRRSRTASLSASFPIVNMRRDAVVGAFSLMELKELPVNLHRLLLPILACVGHVAMLVLWRNRWKMYRSSGNDLPFAERMWVSTPIVFSVLYVSLSYLGTRVMQMHSHIADGVREAMLVHNVYQTLSHFYLAVSILNEASKAGMMLYGNPFTSSERGQVEGESVAQPDRFPVVLLIWMLYYNQYVDFLDTAFIVVRKKSVQLTFLHCFKRILLIWCWFLILKCGCASGDAYIGGAMISTAQVLTYFYYTLGLLGVKGHAGWKPRITELHMISFALLMVHALLSLVFATQPAGMSVAQFAVMGSLLLLFTDFHHKEIIKHGRRRSSQDSSNRRGKRRRRMVFSFDSSGWFYLYHFGVAKYLQEHVFPVLELDQMGFSGASGGALVGATLAANFEVKEIADHVISCQPKCEYNPWKMLPCAEEAMQIFKKQGIEDELSGRLSVLVTRVQRSPPFFKGEAVSEFKTADDAMAMLRASCHVPLLGGVCPYKARESYYYDGFFWPSFFVPWRQFHRADKVIKSSAIGTPGAQIKPRIPMPLWWMVFPPKKDVLRGMYESGYQDAAQYFRSVPDIFEGIVVNDDASSTDSSGALRLLLRQKSHEHEHSIAAPASSPSLLCRKGSFADDDDISGGKTKRTTTAQSDGPAVEMKQGRISKNRADSSRPTESSSRDSQDVTSNRKKYVNIFEEAVYRAWLQFAALVAGSWLTGLTIYALYIDL